MELSEAAALWVAATGQVGAYAHDEHEQEHQRSDSAPPGRWWGYQGGGYRQLTQRQQDAERGRKRAGQAEVDDSLTRSRAVDELGDPFLWAGHWLSKNMQDFAVPESVSEAILERVSRLRPETRQALEEASVLGQVFGFDDLMAVVGLGEDDVEEAMEEAPRSCGWTLQTKG
jgi:hypothetical protein